MSCGSGERLKQAVDAGARREGVMGDGWDREARHQSVCLPPPMPAPLLCSPLLSKAHLLT